MDDFNMGHENMSEQQGIQQNLNTQYQQQFYGGSYQIQSQKNPTFTSYLVQSIIQIVFSPRIIGIVALVLTIIANEAWNKGQYNDYESKSKATKIILIIGWVFFGIGLLMFTLLFATMGIFKSTGW